MALGGSRWEGGKELLIVLRGRGCGGVPQGTSWGRHGDVSRQANPGRSQGGAEGAARVSSSGRILRARG